MSGGDLLIWIVLVIAIILFILGEVYNVYPNRRY